MGVYGSSHGRGGGRRGGGALLFFLAAGAALLLRYGCGYSTRETASLLELSFAAAQKLLQRAKAALRQELEKEGLTV